MNDKERGILMGLVRAQNKMIISQRLGRPQLPEWVWNKIDKAKRFYGVQNIDDIGQDK